MALREPPSEALRANLEQLPEFALSGDRTVITTVPDMVLGFRRITYLGNADRPNTTRY